MGGPGPLSGPLWAVLGRLGAFVGGPGRLGSAFGCYVGGLGPLLGFMLAVLGLMLAVLGRSGSVCWRSWRLLGPLLAVLSRLGLKTVEEHHYLENVLISRAGAAICGLGVGLELLLEPMLVVLVRSWGL